MDTLSIGEARRTAIAAQGFDTRRESGRARWTRMWRTIERLGLLQIDSINVLVRAHYLPLFSRIGGYDTATLDARAFEPAGRSMFEYWGHEASLLPLGMHPLLRWRMARAERHEDIYRDVATLARERPKLVASVLSEVTDRGPLSARELRSRGGRGGSWQWHDGKTALEYLFWCGRISAVARRGFERVYDLTERALPDSLLRLPTPSEADAQRDLLRIAARTLGVATESDLRDYFRLNASDARRAVAALVDSGELTPLQVQGWPRVAYLHCEAKIPRRVHRSALLSPFDPLVWERARTERLFGFHYRLEIYTPAAKRRFGYYVLPFLHGDRLVARVDLRADRSAGELQVLTAHAEVGRNTAEDARALADELARLSGWLGLARIVVQQHGELSRQLSSAVRDAG